MPNLNPNSTNYFHSHEPNTNDLVMAMDYNSLGQPVLRTQFNPTAIDAFGRFRTSNPYTLFDSTLRYGDDTRVWDTVLTGSGTITHLPNESTMAMDVTTASGDKVVRETKRVFVYQPGKSQLTINTFVFAAGKEGLRQRVGLFSVRNGIFIERDGETTYIVKRSYISGIATDVRVAQADWNADTLDGNGDSTVNLDWTKVQIMWNDIEWLGAGTIRIGFVINGQFRLAHSFHHANLIDSVYMTSATLPLRYEIENTTGTASNSRLKHICNTVISEGGSTPRVSPRSVSTPLTGTNLSNTAYTPVIAIRLKSTNIDGVVVPVDIDLYGLQNTAYRYAVYNDVTLTDGTWVSSQAESHVEYNITSTSFTGGRKMLEGIFVGGTISGATNVHLKEHNSALQLTRKANGGTAEVFLLAVQSTTNNDDCVASMIWEEYN
jgi:hypothetical protein